MLVALSYVPGGGGSRNFLGYQQSLQEEVSSCLIYGKGVRCLSPKFRRFLSYDSHYSPFGLGGIYGFSALGDNPGNRRDSSGHMYEAEQRDKPPISDSKEREDLPQIKLKHIDQPNNFSFDPGTQNIHISLRGGHYLKHMEEDIKKNPFVGEQHPHFEDSEIYLNSFLSIDTMRTDKVYNKTDKVYNKIEISIPTTYKDGIDILKERRNSYRAHSKNYEHYQGMLDNLADNFLIKARKIYSYDFFIDQSQWRIVQLPDLNMLESSNRSYDDFFKEIDLESHVFIYH